MHPQLPFSFSTEAVQTFDTFWVGENVLLLDVLRRLAVRPGDDRQVFLAGMEGSGKTHLLTAACHSATQVGERIAYLSAGSIIDGQAVSGLDEFDLVCIDDMEQLPATQDSELALFGFINRLRENAGRLLLAANCVSTELTITLPDLATRLRWGASYNVVPVPADELIAVLSLRAKQSGMEISSDVLEYLLKRYPRHLDSLIACLRFLDQASMQAKRRITVPFAREVLVDFV